MTQSTKKTVLVVDDNEGWRNLLVAALEDEFDVDSIDPGVDNVIKKIQEADILYHVIITDVRHIDRENENEDGLRLVENIKALRKYIEIIVITGYSSVDRAWKVIDQLGAFAYIEKKPHNGIFNLEDFRNIVHQAVDKAEQNRPEGFTSPNLNLLLVGSNRIWLDDLSDSLRNRPYKIRISQNSKQLERHTELGGEIFQLVVFDELILSQKPEMIDIIRYQLPNTNKIILGRGLLDNIVPPNAGYNCRNLVLIPWKEKKYHAFLGTIDCAFDPGAVKYVKVDIAEKKENHRGSTSVNHASLESPYEVILNLYDKNLPSSSPIWLAPAPDQRGQVLLETYFYSQQSEFDPPDAYWEVARSGESDPLIIELIPHITGPLRLRIEIENQGSLLGILEQHVEVAKKE